MFNDHFLYCHNLYISWNCLLGESKLWSLLGRKGSTRLYGKQIADQSEIFDQHKYKNRRLNHKIIDESALWKDSKKPEKYNS